MRPLERNIQAKTTYCFSISSSRFCLSFLSQKNLIGIIMNMVEVSYIGKRNVVKYSELTLRRDTTFLIIQLNEPH